MTVDTTKPEILYLKPDGDGGMFICKSSSPNWTVNGATVTVTSSNKLDGHDEVSVIDDDVKVLRFNRCVNNTEYGCDYDKDFHDSVIVYCKGLFLCNNLVLCICENITCVLEFLICSLLSSYKFYIH